MDQTKQPKGNFVGFGNRYKQANDKRPNFNGRIAVPGSEREFRMALWAGQDRNGQVMFTGRTSDISTSDTALEQIDTMAGVGTDARMLAENNLKLAPGQIVLFRNSYKDEASPARPDFYGRWNPGTGDQLVNVSVWARKSKTNQAMLTGQTQYPLPGKGLEEAAQAQADDAALAGDELGLEEAVRKARSGRT
jgi:hypothetical protein